MIVAAPIHAQQRGPVYLAYAGPHSSSPASAFGHLFLLIADSANVPLPLWDVVSFVADTEDAGTFKFFVGGITGAFDGRFERVEFHQKIRDYEAIDDRDLWLLELSLSEDQRQGLEEAITRVAQKRYPYTFFVRNCAYYLQQLLAEAGLGVPLPEGPTSPTEVWLFLDELGLGGRTLFRPAASERLAAAFEGLPGHVLARLKHESWESVLADSAWLSSLTLRERVTVSDLVEWRMLHRATLLPASTMQGLTQLRASLAAGRIEHPDLVAATGNAAAGDVVQRPRFHGYPRISTGYRRGPHGGRMQLRLRPALHDAADPWTAHRPVNTLEFLTIEASGDVETGDVRLEKLVMFSQRSLNDHTWIHSPGSWAFEAQFERGGLVGRGLQAGVRAGMGRAWSVGPLHAYALVLSGTSISADDAVLSLGVESGALLLPRKGWRAGVQWTHERDVFDPMESSFDRGEIWIRYDIHSDIGLRLVTRWTSNNASQFAVFDWYP